VRRRGAVAWYPAEVSVTASVHGLTDRLVSQMQEDCLQNALVCDVADAHPAPIFGTGA
jgi:hypothetical protein